jgi:hypothetical protein
MILHNRILEVVTRALLKLESSTKAERLYAAGVAKELRAPITEPTDIGEAIMIMTLVQRLRDEYPRTGAYAPEATCLHGIHPYDCRQGCAPPVFEAADEIEQLRAALKVAQQSLVEFSHAQEVGPSWYTRGANGMYQQVSLWLRRGLEAVQGALGPYDDNGQYEKEKP